MPRQLDYTALNEPVTKADVAAYKAWAGDSWGEAIKKWTYGAGLLLVVVFVFFTFRISKAAIRELPGALVSSSILTVLFAASFVVLAACVVAIMAWPQRKLAKLYKFAVANGLQLIVDEREPSYAGMIFDNGRARRIDAALRFRDGAEIGNYTYVTGSGKNQQTHTWGYARIKLVRRLPHMVLDAKSNNFWKFSNLSDSFDRSQTLALEGDFNTYFTLYVPKEYERDALYVFTPDVMAIMIDQGRAYDIEIVDDELFIYNNQHFSLDSPGLYGSLLSIIDAIRSELISQTDYYADERVGSRAANIIAPQGQRLKSGFNWLVVVIILIVVYFQIIQPIIFRLMHQF